MTSVKISCLKGKIQSGNHSYPVFIGFSNARSLASIAEAPSFTDQTSHQQIATNILTPPVKDWQRPVDQDRVSEIANVYNRQGEIMPNPVLICENTTLSNTPITITQAHNNGVPLNTWEIEIPIPQGNHSKPTWILDGQHRIGGLETSSQANTDLPVVLLINHGNTNYSPALLAKIFAQVTTEATKLKELHDEWLTFAFRLDQYSSSNTQGDAAYKSMETVALLCERPIVCNGTLTNPFHNRIKFNDYQTSHVGPTSGGFKYNCSELKELVYAFYYNANCTHGTHLSPTTVGEEIVKAYEALLQSVPAPQHNSVFLGGPAKGQQIMQDAFIVGVLTRLRFHGQNNDWNQLLTDLAFSTTSWDFTSWVVTLNGQAQSQSKKLARNVLSQTFQSGQLPTQSGNIADYLKGNESEVEIIASALTPSGRPSRNNRHTEGIRGGINRTVNISAKQHVKFNLKTSNISAIKIIDAQSPAGSEICYRHKGFILSAEKHQNPLKLVIKMIHYGGTESTAKIDLTW